MDVLVATLSGWAKALWVLVIVVAPLLGTLVHLIVRGRGMNERSAQEYARRQDSLRAYLQDVAADAGTITAQEFETQKAKLLA